MLKILNGVRLVRFEPDLHTAQLYQWYYSGDYPEFYRNYPSCPSIAEVAASANGKSLMIVNEANNIVGVASHFKENEVSRNFEVGILIDKNVQNNGYGITALKILLHWKFNYCNLYKVKLNPLVKNKRIAEILDRFGASQEGVLKKENFLHGEFHNVAVYAMFKTEFNKRYQQEFENPISLDLKGPRLESHILNGDSHVRGLPGAFETVSRPAIWVDQPAS